MDGKYYHTKESVLEYIKMAKDVNGQELIDELKKYLRKDAKLLEIGSGPGSDWEILSRDYNVTGSDYSEEFLVHLKKKYPNGNFLYLNAIDLKTEDSFDVLYANKVFQHLNNEEIKKAIQRQAAILNESGLICLSFWKGEGEEIFKGMLVNYQNEQSLETLFTPYFEILLLKTYQEFEKGDSILLIGRKR